MPDCVALVCACGTDIVSGQGTGVSLSSAKGKLMRTDISATSRVVRVLLAASLITVLSVSVWGDQQERVSKPGVYAGYSEELYGEWMRTSQYVTMRDGVKLAVDVFRPAVDGVPVRDPLPVIWEHRRYHRANISDGKLRTQLDREGHWLPKVLKHGYIVGVVDVRGGGASYGSRSGPFSPRETLDAYDITEWFAAQDWCSGRVGMYGISYSGTAQLMAASAAPPHLVAIFPEMAAFDSYSFARPGGIYRHNTIGNWSKMSRSLDLHKTRTCAPVDDDPDGKMMAEAVKQHHLNLDISNAAITEPYRDGVEDSTEMMIYIVSSPSNYVRQVRKSGVAVYLRAGWFDMYPRDMILWFENLDNSKKLAIGPWNHYESYGFDLSAEHLRWYDYWLKGIDNGIMDEPPIIYYTMGAARGEELRWAEQWPPPNAEQTRYYFHNGPSGSVSSINDGLLTTKPPGDFAGRDDYKVDYTTTSGKATRWTQTSGIAPQYPDMTQNDQKGLTYTTEPLAGDVEATGNPIVHLWVSSTAEDGDFFAYLEEIGRDGASHYITEGLLRASHRPISAAPFNNMGLPYHRSFAEDITELPDEPVELIFDLIPTSNVFDVGHRIRVTITCADRDNALTPELTPVPVVTVFRNSVYASYIAIPVIPK
jgi:putative CocE/NonD family hydrolase